ncbi:hypothetical protein ASPACDRAFT_58590 [Aspergillus aculeatus ATCC 16872]|uniref:Uncharacterized protein n=1 Tax=Aspergillus aculeatus (strain ATCC 16872 / CBS 172.66 / WB 5094) TaxID=690307 RepID=A0A1L9X1D0_ASPA1|nr:uncharacterized protein ASPACDRAFT_58590 [Aspergillus aculeatus ATCC 16872]OJK02243.1 hypothetical protein ASPACDRAFT_58590 [Aspergillus aculeatus ATCC 16872]
MKKILEAVNAGTLPLNYARWLRYSAANAGNNPYIVPGVILELAYWIGPEVGTVGDSTYDQYRDMTDGTGADQWVVFHLHFDEGGETSNVHPFVSITQNGRTRTYARTASIRVYHGRYTVTAGNNLRVQSDSGSSTWRTSAFYCSGNAHWDIGRTDLTPTADTWGDDLQRWGINLRSTYLRAEPWRLVYPELSVTGTEIDADWITRVAEPSEYAASSWVLTDTRQVDTDVYIPNIPPPGRS